MSNKISLIGKTVYTNPIYSASIFCNSQSAVTIPCSSVGFSLSFFNNSNFSNFAIDASVRLPFFRPYFVFKIVFSLIKQNVYLTSPFVYDNQIQTKYVFIINNFITSNVLRRFDSNVYNEVSVIVEENQLNEPKFEYPSYSISILNSVPIGSIVLSIRYMVDPSESVDFYIEQMSNSEILKYFSLRKSYQSTISLFVIASPIISDKPDLTFSITIASKNKLKSNYTATTKVHLELLTPFTVANFPKFQQPYMPSEQILIEFKNLMNNLIIYTFKATNSNLNSTIEYRIVNGAYATNFYIEGNNLCIFRPIQNAERNNFLVS